MQMADKIIMRPVEALIPYARNARTHSEAQVAQIAGSIRELVRAGTIGTVVNTVGLGPHRIDRASRRGWCFERERYGGILADIASHQIEQFLFFTGAEDAEVAAATVANRANPAHPELQDFGDMLLRTSGATGYVRVDWLTPDGLPAWGPTRILSERLINEGYLLAEDLELVVDQASRRYELFAVAREPVAPVNRRHPTLTPTPSRRSKQPPSRWSPIGCWCVPTRLAMSELRRNATGQDDASGPHQKALQLGPGSVDASFTLSKVLPQRLM
jgi:Oxidoreductase family, C-terminal alpha/beta domain